MDLGNLEVMSMGRLKQETRLVEQLSAQARLEQATAREVRDSVEQLRQQTQTDKVSRAVGVCWNVCGCKVSIFVEALIINLQDMNTSVWCVSVRPA